MKKEIIKSMKGYRPKVLVFVVYKTKNGGWRGFCSPYDITCEAENETEAMNRLERLFGLYEKGLKKYGYPKHLSVRPLSDKSDQAVFRKVMEKVAADIERKLNKDFLDFQSEEQKESFKIENAMKPSGYYLCPV